MKHNVPFFVATAAILVLLILVPGLHSKALKHAPWPHVNPDYHNPGVNTPELNNQDIGEVSGGIERAIGDKIQDISGVDNAEDKPEPEVKDTDVTELDKGYELNIKPELIIKAPKQKAITSQEISELEDKIHESDASEITDNIQEEEQKDEKVGANIAESQEKQDGSEAVKLDPEREANITEAKRRIKEAYERGVAQYGDPGTLEGTPGETQQEDAVGNQRLLADLVMQVLIYMIDAGMLDETQVDELCDWICANYPCPPDCPGYYEPPWG